MLYFSYQLDREQFAISECKCIDQKKRRGRRNLAIFGRNEVRMVDGANVSMCMTVRLHRYPGLPCILIITAQSRNKEVTTSEK